MLIGIGAQGISYGQTVEQREAEGTEYRYEIALCLYDCYRDFGNPSGAGNGLFASLAYGTRANPGENAVIFSSEKN